MKKTGRVIALYVLLVALLTACRPQQIPIATGSIRIAGAHDYLDSVQIQGNGSMRVYRRYSDVDAYCTSDSAVMAKVMHIWNDKELANQAVYFKYRYPIVGETTTDLSNIRPGVCFTEPNMTLNILLDVSSEPIPLQ